MDRTRRSSSRAPPISAACSPACHSGIIGRDLGCAALPRKIQVDLMAGRAEIVAASVTNVLEEHNVFMLATSIE